MDGAFPAIDPYRSGFLETADGQQIYFEESGNPAGLPVVMVHGGPASSTPSYRRRFFRPTVYRIIGFDQRGAGRSKPSGILEKNTTSHLVDDMEALRKHLGVERWVIFGGSWGATLALCYVQRYSEHVRALLLRGTLLGRSRDLEWFFGACGVASMMPEAYERFLAPLPAHGRARPLPAYAELLCSDRPDVRMEAAAAWAGWEASVARGPRCTSTDAVPDARLSATDADRYAIAATYARNGFFLEPECGALPDTQKLAQVPGFIIHGRLDFVCPLENAITLHQAWPNAELRISEGAGHLDVEPSLVAALVSASEAIGRAAY